VKLNNYRIGARLMMGFSLVFVLMAAIVTIGYYALNSIGDKLDRIVNVNNAKILQSNDMIDAVHVTSRVVRSIALLDDVTAKNKERERIIEARNQYSEAKRKYETLLNTDEEKALFNKTNQIEEQAMAINDKIVELAMANKIEEATSILMGEGDAKQTAWRDSMRALNNFSEKRTQMRYDEASKGADRARILSVTLGGVAIILGLIIAIIITRSITNPLSNLVNVAGVVATGDLTKDITVNSKDETGKLSEAFKIMVNQMREVVREIIEKAAAVSASSQQLNSSAQQTSASANENAATMGEISTTVEQVTSSIQEISAVSEAATEHASKGYKGIAKVTEQMNIITTASDEVSKVIEGLNKKSQEINQIVVLITSIADQTNLLALNAAIEAARAGEQGRGFAVVAEEVRKLAEQSASAAKEIYNLINAIQIESKRAVESMAEGGKQVKAGTGIVQEVGDNFKEIIGAVQGLTSQIQEVASATEQMSAGVQNVAASTEEQTAAMEEVSASAESLSSLAEELNSLVDRFKV